MKEIKKDIKEREDDELLKEAKQEFGNDALSLLFIKYRHLVFGLCLKYFKNHHQAEDETIAIYEKLVVKIKKHDVKHFKSWLYTLTKNHCFEVLRSRKNKEPKIKEASLMYSEEIFHPDNVLEKEKEIALLNDCVNKLADLQKTCVELFYFKKQSYEEISKTLGMEWSKIRSNIQNGRRNLKNCLENK